MMQDASTTERLPFSRTFVDANGHSLLPGGFGKSLTAVGPWSPKAACGEGWRLWDEDGNERIDLHGNFTVNVHDNAHPAVVEAASRAVADRAAGIEKAGAFGATGAVSETFHRALLRTGKPWGRLRCRATGGRRPAP